MKVKDLIEALQKVENQDAVVLFWDPEMNKQEIIGIKSLEVFETCKLKWNDETSKYDEYKEPAIELGYLGGVYFK